MFFRINIYQKISTFSSLLMYKKLKWPALLHCVHRRKNFVNESNLTKSTREEGCVDIPLILVLYYFFYFHQFFKPIFSIFFFKLQPWLCSLKPPLICQRFECASITIGFSHQSVEMKWCCWTEVG